MRPWGYAALAIVALALTAGGVTGWEYTNSPAFCGETCHTMPPEYAAYQLSPHARVQCVECHIGRDRLSVVLGRKAGDITHVIRYATSRYEFPLEAKSMRPARDSCERCHWPEKFSDDSLRQIVHHRPDEANTPEITTLLLRTGGGTRREGRGYGIHWHIENQVWYVAQDEARQHIVWVKVVDAEGLETEYLDAASGLGWDEIDRSEARLMDCMDCHNRVSHLFRSPEDSVDRALRLKQMDASLPFLRREAVQLLRTSYASAQQARQAIADGLTGFYRQRYPAVFRAKEDAIERAVVTLQEIYAEIVFPDMQVSWETHPNSLGHRDWPGCFRCHDGKHLDHQDEAIRLECNLCHSIPRLTVDQPAIQEVRWSTDGEPESHQSPNWMAEHRVNIDPTCSSCHGEATFGTDNSRFCANVVCHGQSWGFVGLDAPKLREMYPTPTPTPTPTVTPTSTPTATPTPRVTPVPVTPISGGTAAPTPTPSPGGTAAPTPTPSLPPPTAAPSIPHALEGYELCTACHVAGAGEPLGSPADHAGREAGACRTCH